MKKILLLLPLLCLVLFTQAKKVDLALRLETGHVYPLIQVSNATIVQEVMGQKMSINMTISGDMEFAVTGEVNGVYEMDVKYTKLNMEMKMPQGNVTFSSETGANDPMSGIFAKMVNQVFQIEMTEKGKVLSVKKIDELFTNAFAALPDMPEAQKQKVLEQVQKAYGEKAFTGSIESMMAVFPADEVKEGDSWQNEVKLEAGMSAIQASTYTLKGEEDGAYVLQGEGRITTADNDDSIKSAGIDMKLDLNGTVISDIKLDKKCGWVLAATVTQALAGKAIVKANEQLPNGLDIPMTMDTTTTYAGEN